MKNKIQRQESKVKVIRKKGEKQISISGFERFNLSDFERWKNSIENTLSQKQLTGNSIIEKIRNFPVISKSPIECQQYLIELQNEING